MKQLKNQNDDNQNDDNQTDLQAEKLRGCFGCPYISKVHKITTRASSAPWNIGTSVRINCSVFRDGKNKNTPGSTLLKPTTVKVFNECVHWVREQERLRKARVIKREVRLRQIQNRDTA